MPLDLSSFPDEPTIVKPEKDKALAKTISDIEAGKPAPKTHWQGKELPGYSQPGGSQSKLDISGFPTDKKEPVKPEPKKDVSFGKQLAKETAGAVGGLADIVSGLGTSLAGTATAATVGAVTGSSVKGREYAEKITSLMPTNMAPQVRDTIAYHAMMYPFEKISQGIDYLSGKVEEKHGKEAGAAAKTSLEIAAMAVPIPGLKAAKGAATEALTKPNATDVANLRAKFDAQNKSYNAMEALKKVQAEKVAEIRDPSTGVPMKNVSEFVGPGKRGSLTDEQLRQLNEQTRAKKAEEQKLQQSFQRDPTTGAVMSTVPGLGTKSFDFKGKTAEQIQAELNQIVQQPGQLKDPSTGAILKQSPSFMGPEKSRTSGLSPKELIELNRRIQEEQRGQAKKKAETRYDPVIGAELRNVEDFVGPKKASSLSPEELSSVNAQLLEIQRAKVQSQKQQLADVASGGQLKNVPVTPKEQPSFYKEKEAALKKSVEDLIKRKQEEQRKAETTIDPSTGAPMPVEGAGKGLMNMPQRPATSGESPLGRGKLGEPISPRRGVGAKQGGAVDPEVFVEGLRKAGLSFKEFSDRIAQEFGEGARAMAVDLYQGQTSPEKQRGVVKQTLADIGRWTKLEPAHKMPTDELIRTRNGEINAYNRVLRNQKDRWEQLVPSEEARNEISRAIETKTVETLTPEQQTVAREYMAFRDQIGKEGMDVGVLKGVLDDYVTHIVEEANDKSVAQRIVEDVFSTVQARDAVGGSPKSGFGKERKYKVTMDELNNILREKGLRVKTQDIGQIAEQYGKSMRRAIENKKLVDNLKETPAFDSSRPYLFKPTDEYPAPRDWKYLNHPQTQGMAVHPELYDSLKTVLSSNDPNVIERGLYNLSMGTKRLNVIGSMFHAKSLGEVYANAMGRDIFSGVTDALKKFHEGGLGDELDLGMKQGLKLEIPHDVDVKILQEAGKFADKMFPKAGTPFRMLDAINSRIDNLTWNYMHTGLKSALFLREFERVGNENPGMPKEQVAREVATYVNDLAGGLDWFGIAADAKTQLGREIGMAFASPRGQMLAQILMFAPDWTISTLRAGWNGVSSLPTSIARFEALSPKTKEGLYQRYAMRSALLWLTVLNGINMMTAGKPIWDNQDPTRIELKDGTTMQAGKHTFEFVHAMTDPVKFAYNKLGIAPRTAVDTFAEMKGAEPFPGQADKSLPRRLAESALPFSVQPFLDPSMTSSDALTRAVAGFAGVPIYGFTPEQKAEQRAARRLRKRQKMQEWKLKQAN